MERPFFITFKSDEHPVLPAATTKAYATVIADSTTAAVAIANDKLGKDHWAFIFTEDRFDKSLYPDGNIATF